MAVWDAGPPRADIHWSDELLPALRRGRAGAEEAFIAYFWPLVTSEARRYGRVGGDVDELMGEASLALWEAAVQYRQDHHRTTFSEYVKNHVHRRVRRAYLKGRGYDGTPVPIPLHPNWPDTSADPLSLAEWRFDLNQALRSLEHDERSALAWGPGSEQTRMRKRRQRARTHLRRLLLGEEGSKP
jgi:DNA-directed RNA polymerase specialized sigma24 family protein